MITASKIGKKRSISVLLILSIITLIYFLQIQFITAQDDNVQVNVDLFPLSREIEKGELIRAVTRIDTNKNELIDIVINYTITNNGGLEVFQKSKTLAVSKTAKVTENYLMIHKSLDPGPYLVNVEVIYGDTRKVERATFNVVAEPVALAFGYRELTFLLIVILIISFILLWIKSKRAKNE